MHASRETTRVLARAKKDKVPAALQGNCTCRTQPAGAPLFNMLRHLARVKKKKGCLSQGDLLGPRIRHILNDSVSGAVRTGVIAPSVRINLVCVNLIDRLRGSLRRV